MQHIHNGRVRTEGNILFLNSFVNTQAMGAGDMHIFWICYVNWFEERSVGRVIAFCVFASWDSVGLQAVMCVCVCVCLYVRAQFGTAKSGGVRKLLRKLLYSLCYSEISDDDLEKGMRWILMT